MEAGKGDLNPQHALIWCLGHMVDLVFTSGGSGRATWPVKPKQAWGHTLGFQSQLCLILAGDVGQDA